MDQNYCRLCLKQDTWNCPLSVFAEGFEILSKIFLVHGIQIFENDSFSKVICHLCLAKLEFMDGIRKKVSISNSILKGIVQTGESRSVSGTQTVPQLEAEQPTEMRCSKCQFTTDKASELSAHVDLHNGAAVRNCPRCSVTVQTEDDLAYHMKRKHKNRTLAIHYCTQCSKLVYGNEQFNKHCQQHVTNSPENNPVSVQHRTSKKKHKKDKLKENQSKPVEAHRERIVLKISKTASNDDDSNDTNGVANKVPFEENNPKTSSIDSSSQVSTTGSKDQTNVNNSETLLSNVSDKSQTSFNNKENILVRSRPHPETSHKTPAKKPRVSACFVPISPINMDMKCNGTENDGGIEKGTTAVPVPFGGEARNEAAIEDDGANRSDQCVRVSVSGGEEFGTNDGNGIADLMESYDSDLESDEIYTKLDNSKWLLSDANRNRLNTSRKRMSSSIHLQSPVVGKLLRQSSSINLRAGQELPSDVQLTADEWDPVTASQRIYIDVDDDDDGDVLECRKQPSSDGSCQSFASLNRFELEDAIEIKEEYLSD